MGYPDGSWGCSGSSSRRGAKAPPQSNASADSAVRGTGKIRPDSYYKMATNLSLRLKNMLTNHQGWHLNTCSRKYALQNDHSWADQIAIVTESEHARSGDTGR